MKQKTRHIDLDNYLIPNPSYQERISRMMIDIAKYELEILSNYNYGVILTPKFTLYYGVNKITTPKELVDAVCKIFNIDKSVLQKGSREREIVVCRIVIAKIIKDNFKISLVEIAEIVLGTTDHASIIHYLRKAEKYLTVNIKSLWENEKGNAGTFHDVYNIIMTELV